ncbi:fibronectin type III domain-containing protein [Candidatus Uhrbacteria bacterium]|nr:fibronectin type III domain-containing protein [Candidatus Uhrbacteria bacterium]
MKRIGILFTLIFILISALWRAPLVSATMPEQLRLSWQNDPKTTMTVMWRTDEQQPSPRAQYGTDAQYGSAAEGATIPAVFPGYFYHTVEITGLTPGTTYHYRVSKPQGTWSNDFTFRTAPAGPVDFTFTAFGDNGSSTASGDRALRVQSRAVEQNPSLHLVAGDLTYADKEKCDASEKCVERSWEQWFSEMQQISAQVPVMTAIGNHEKHRKVKFENGDLFYNRSLALPPAHNELYYSFDYGDVHFTILDSVSAGQFRRGKEQYNFVEQDLAATSKTFKVVVFHHLPYTSGHSHNADRRIQEELTPLLERFNVDLVIVGHNHHYERTYPLKYKAPNDPEITSTGSEYTTADGIVYVVTGGGGRSVYKFGTEKPAWSAVRCECHEIVRVDVDDAGILTVRAIDIDGNEVDRFTISKNSSQSSVHSAQPPTQPTALPQPNNSITQSLNNSQSIRGFNYAVWWHDSLGKPEARRSLDDLKATGANYAAFAPFWYQDAKTSTAIARDGRKSATDESLTSAIRYAKSIGLRVAFKPMVDSRDGTWRGKFEPADADAWFASYQDFILHYASLADAEGIDYFVVGTEFASLTRPQYTEKWREIIRETRAAYDGPITYAANWGKRHEGEYYQVEFWDALDAIGIDAYFPVSRDENPDVAGVQNAWTFIHTGNQNQNWFADIRAKHEEFQKPVLFTEIGFLSCNGAGIEPWKYPCERGIDLDEQAALYEGTMRFWKDVDWMQGFLWWRWDVDPDKGGPQDGDYLAQNKAPTIDALKRFWLAFAPSLPSALPPSAPLSPVVEAPTVSIGNSGGGAAGLVTTPSSTVPTFPTSSVRLPTPNYLITQSPNYLRPFAYNQPRLRSLDEERARAWELAQALHPRFQGRIPLHRQHWPIYINAYIYGGYPADAIYRSIQLSGKTVHTSIPWSAWRKSAEYQSYMR